MPESSTPRRKKRRQRSQRLPIAIALVLVLALGGLGVLVVFEIANRLLGGKAVALAEWNPDPARLAGFTQRLPFDQYTFRAPTELIDISKDVAPPRDASPNVKTQSAFWMLPKQDQTEWVLASAKIVDSPLVALAASDKNRLELLEQLVARQTGRQGWSTSEKFDPEWGEIGGLRFVRVRLNGTDEDIGEGRIPLYGFIAVHCEKRRALVLQGWSIDPPGGEGYAILESLLYSLE